MPAIDFTEVGIAFDMHGCPNRCRHCFYGPMPNERISEDDVRRIARLFRDFRRKGDDEPLFRKLSISTHVREPDRSDDYRRLHELAAELSNGPPWRYELLSVWRLARDESYAEWARSVGPDTCQITFFGEEQTTDWFCRRKGAFADNLAASERLLEVGMKPRWQVFANTQGLSEFDGLMRLVDKMRLRERVAELGADFKIFVHTWHPSGGTLDIEHLRPTVREMAAIPEELLEASRKKYAEQVPWQSEGELCREILSCEPWFGYALEPGHMPWFVVTSAFEVFFNGFGYDPWFCLGNIRNEPLAAILSRFENNEPLGLRTVFTMPPQELVRKYGNADGERSYDDKNGLLALYVARHCERLSG